MFAVCLGIIIACKNLLNIALYKMVGPQSLILTYPYAVRSRHSINLVKKQTRNYSTKPDNFNPVISYSNADTQKLQIIRENRKKSGIYR